MTSHVQVPGERCAPSRKHLCALGGAVWEGAAPGKRLPSRPLSAVPLFHAGRGGLSQLPTPNPKYQLLSVCVPGPMPAPYRHYCQSSGLALHTQACLCPGQRWETEAQGGWVTCWSHADLLTTNLGSPSRPAARHPRRPGVTVAWGAGENCPQEGVW